MWFLGAIASFGLAFFPLFYFSVDRRNRHFEKQLEFEKRVTSSFEKDWTPTPALRRNAKLWAASIILILPVFVIVYFLSQDLNDHEKRQTAFLAEFFPERKYMPQWIPVKTCAIITVATLGFGAVYWLYRLVNAYNNHFKEQLHIEHELLKMMETTSHVESV
jgi:hypothetical protein